MSKFIIGSMFAAVVFITPVSAFAQVATSTDSGGAHATPCYYMLGIGAKWCENTPELQSLWRDVNVREAIRALYILIRAN